MGAPQYAACTNEMLDYMIKNGKITGKDISETESNMIDEVMKVEGIEIPKVMYRRRKECGQYFLNVPACYSKTGKRHQITALQEEEVEKLFKQEAYAVITHQIEKREREKITVQEIIGRFIAESSISESSKSKYYRDHRNFIEGTEFGMLSVVKVRYYHCEDFVKSLQLKLTHSSLLQIKSVIKQSFDYAISRDIMLRNYMLGVKINANLCKKSVRDTERIYSVEEIGRLENASIDAWEKKKYRNSVVYLCQLYTGLRVGELMALKWENVDLEKGILSIIEGRKEFMDYEKRKKIRVSGVTKNKQSERIIYLNNNALYWFIELNDRNSNINSPYVVTTKNGTIPSYENLYTTIKKFCNYAKVEYGATHICRKTNISLRIANGDNPVNVSKDAGHKKLTTTLDVYNKYNDIKESLEKQNEIFENMSCHHMPSLKN